LGLGRRLELGCVSQTAQFALRVIELFLEELGDAFSTLSSDQEAVCTEQLAVIKAQLDWVLNRKG
jgi:hypothetical protein